jgi:hypothetical protein
MWPAFEGSGAVKLTKIVNPRPFLSLGGYSASIGFSPKRPDVLITLSLIL